MHPFSIVIITYNEEDYIGDCLDALKDVSDDVIVVDAQSTDRTCMICKQRKVRLESRSWEGYGDAKNYGASIAIHPWILSVDADELCTPQLMQSLKSWIPASETVVYSIKRINFIAGRPLRYSHLHPEWKPRLYHRDAYQWNDAPVHEQLMPKTYTTAKLSGALHHYQAKDLNGLMRSYRHYAELSKSVTTEAPVFRIQIWYAFSALYHFFRSYLLMLGFIEGRLGFDLAICRARLAWLKRPN